MATDNTLSRSRGLYHQIESILKENGSGDTICVPVDTFGRQAQHLFREDNRPPRLCKIGAGCGERNGGINASRGHNPDAV
jgi:hypothetical protein